VEGVLEFYPRLPWPLSAVAPESFPLHVSWSIIARGEDDRWAGADMQEAKLLAARCSLLAARCRLLAARCRLLAARLRALRRCQGGVRVLTCCATVSLMSSGRQITESGVLRKGARRAHAVVASAQKPGFSDLTGVRCCWQPPALTQRRPRCRIMSVTESLHNVPKVRGQ
jgi:hypothetical protein